MIDQQKIDALVRIKAQMYKEIDFILKKVEQKLVDLQKNENHRLEERYY